MIISQFNVLYQILSQLIYEYFSNEFKVKEKIMIYDNKYLNIRFFHLLFITIINS